MTDKQEIYSTFPHTGTVRIAAGTTLLDFHDGVATLPDASTRKISRPLVKGDAYKSLYIELEFPVTIEASLNDEVQLSVTLQSGIYRFRNLSYDYIKLIATKSTNVLLISSTDPEGTRGSRDKPISGAVTELYNVVAGVAVGATARYTSAELDVSNLSYIRAFVQVTYNGAAAAGCRVDVLTEHPDSDADASDPYATAVVPSFTAGAVVSKHGGAVDVRDLGKIKISVLNLDAAQALTLTKLFMYGW